MGNDIEILLTEGIIEVTLLNTLTQAGVLAENKLFATLDTKSRRLHLPSGLDVVIADTVGFIRDMPKDLLVAFRATFEEARHSSLMIELLDASDPEQEQHAETTTRLLQSLDFDGIPRLRVLNKLDALDAAERALLESSDDCIAISASERSTLTPLLSRLDSELRLLGYTAGHQAAATADS